MNKKIIIRLHLKSIGDCCLCRGIMIIMEIVTFATEIRLEIALFAANILFLNVLSRWRIICDNNQCYQSMQSEKLNKIY